MANSIVDPKDPDYCETCGGECVAGCKTADDEPEPAYFLVSIDRTTVYRVKAEDAEDAMDAAMLIDAKEVDQTTTDMRAERDDNQED